MGRLNNRAPAPAHGRVDGFEHASAPKVNKYEQRLHWACRPYFTAKDTATASESSKSLALMAAHR